MASDFSRFLTAQDRTYVTALSEIRAGRKVSHWMWYIFPQIRGLGHSETAKFYAIRDLEEAARYLHHPILGIRLVEASKAVLEVENGSAHDIFRSPDDLKLRSSMTLFAQAEKADPVFKEVLLKYFSGRPDPHTIEMIQRQTGK